MAKISCYDSAIATQTGATNMNNIQKVSEVAYQTKKDWTTCYKALKEANWSVSKAIKALA
jgi:hypothetical protein